jgi:hypothetical protein
MPRSTSFPVYTHIPLYPLPPPFNFSLISFHLPPPHTCPTPIHPQGGPILPCPDETTNPAFPVLPMIFLEAVPMRADAQANMLYRFRQVEPSVAFRR